jgi:hypothetical protein
VAMKKEYIILSIVIVVLSAYLYFHKEGKSNYTLPVLADLSKTDITKIDVSKAGKHIVLEQTGENKWVVGDDKLPVSESIIKTMSKIIQNLKVTTLISESGNYNRYDLDDTNKITVTAWNGTSKIRMFDVGKPASTFHHTFVRLENDPKVYYAEENFRTLFDKTEDGVVDKEVLKFETQSIKGIQVKTPDKTLAIEQKKSPSEPEKTPKDNPASPEKEPAKPAVQQTRDVWVDASGKEHENANVSNMLSVVNSLRCDAYIKGAKKENYTNPVYQITLNENGKTISLSIFGRTDEKSGYPAVSTEKNTPFLLPAAKVDEIKTKIGGM